MSPDRACLFNLTRGQAGPRRLENKMEITTLLMLIATWVAAPLAQGGVVQTARSPAPTVDLGYANYQGYHDDAYGLNVWKR